MKPRQQHWKWLVLGLVAFLLVGLAVLPRQIGSSEQLRERIASALSSWAGGEVALSEPWSLRYFPSLTLRGGFTVGGASKLPLIESLSTQDAKISLDLGALLLGRINIDGMRLNRPVITLKESRATPAQIANLLSGTTVDALRVRGGVVKSASGSGKTLITGLNARFEASNGGGAVSGLGTFDYRGQTVRFVVDSGSLAETEGGVQTPFHLRISGPFAATINGTATFAPAFRAEGYLQAEIKNGRQFLTWTGMPAHDGQSLQDLSISGPMQWRGSTLTVDGGSFGFDGNAAVGLLALTIGERPKIDGTLAFERLALDPYLGAHPADDAEPRPQEVLFAGTLLKHVDADLRVSAAQIATSAMELGRGGFTLNAKQGVVAAEIGELELCGGAAAGRIGLDLAHPKIKASLAGSVTDIDIEPCLKPLALDIPFRGTGSLKADLATEGSDVDELVRGLTGPLAINAQNGAVPVDFAQLLTASTPLDGSGWSLKNLTPFETLDADCRLYAGHIWCQMFRMQTSRGLVSGTGDVDMRRRTLNWNLSVTDTVPVNTAQLALEPRPQVSIWGPLTQPTIRRADRPALGKGPTGSSPRDTPGSSR